MCVNKESTYVREKEEEEKKTNSFSFFIHSFQKKKN